MNDSLMHTMPNLNALAILTFLALTYGPQPTAYSQAPPSPAAPFHTLWRVQGKTNTVYLLGSVHFLSPEEIFPDAIDRAYRDAEQLIMEIDMDDLDPTEVQQSMADLGLLPSGETLQSQLGPQAYARVAAQARDIGMDPALLDRLRPWLAALTLVQLNLKKMGLESDSGVEHKLLLRATADKKAITGLETIQQQLGILAALPPVQQREFLLYSVEDMERANAEINDLITAWRKGDTTTLARLLTEGLDQYPDLYRPLTLDRNRQWLHTIEGLLDDRDDYLVVVGALHLVGKGSVIDLLAQRGHRALQQ